MMAGFAEAGVVAAAGTGQVESTGIIADCEKIAQNWWWADGTSRMVKVAGKRQ